MCMCLWKGVGVGGAPKAEQGAVLRQRKPNKRGDHTAHNGGVVVVAVVGGGADTLSTADNTMCTTTE